MSTLNRYFLEPLSTLTHLVGAVAALIGLVVLLVLSQNDPPKMISMFVYGSSMVVLYVASSLLHGVKIEEEKRMWLNRLDHMAIFLVIAGTYTPIAYNLFSDAWRWGVLVTVWLVAAVGMAYKLFSIKIHGFLNSSIYLILGWGSAMPLVFASNLVGLVPWQGFFLLLLGGLVYTIGFVIYYLERPDPWPDVFGHHEIWHLCVMAGSLSHFLFIFFYVIPFERVGG